MTEKFTIEGIHVKTTRKIAEGGFAVVHECKDDRNQTLALKKMFFLEQDQLEAIEQELKFLKLLQHHDLFVQLIAYDVRQNERPKVALFLMEFCPSNSN
jgi:serine/threonine protein kinase